jgi:hypothetical protein
VTGFRVPAAPFKLDFTGTEYAGLEISDLIPLDRAT